MQPSPRPAPVPVTSPGAWTTATKTALVVQVLALGVLRFGDIGFDKPGRFGLDFGHFLMLAGLYLTALIVGLWGCARARRWGWLAGQFLVPVALLAAVALARGQGSDVPPAAHTRAATSER